MRALREEWKYPDRTKVLVQRYRNADNVPHWHYDCELHFVEKGGFEIVCNQTPYKVTGGQAFFINSKEVHSMHALEAETYNTLIVFDYEIIKPLIEHSTLLYPVLSRDYAIPELAKSLKGELHAKPALYEYQSSALIMQKMIEIFRGEKITPREGYINPSERLKNLLADMDQNFEFYDLKNAAAYMGMNVSYFSRFFHKLTGTTFSSYLNHVKTLKAVSMLRSSSDFSVTEIAGRCGFATIRNFNRIFKSVTGYSPTSLPENFVLKEKISLLKEDSSDPNARGSTLVESTNYTKNSNMY